MIVDLFCNSKEGGIYECSTLPFLRTCALVGLFFFWVSCYHTLVVEKGFLEVGSRNKKKNLLRNLLCSRGLGNWDMNWGFRVMWCTWSIALFDGTYNLSWNHWESLFWRRCHFSASFVAVGKKEAVLRLLVMAVAYFYARFYVLLTFTFPSLRGYDKDLLVCFFSLWSGVRGYYLLLWIVREGVLSNLSKRV